MIEYVVGLVFDENFDNVLLVRKNRPDWQVGKLNGVGGKVEEGEVPYEAMIRECEEECGLTLYNWLLVDTFTDDSTYNVYFFVVQTPSLSKAYTKTDEVIGVFNVKELIVADLNTNIVVYPTNNLIFMQYKQSHTEEDLYG